MTTTRRVLFIGPLPPPLEGFSLINEQMRAALSRATSVEVFNRAREVKSNGKRAARFVAALRLPRMLMRFARCALEPGPQAVYLALSGGRGQLLDLPFALMAAALRLPVFVHHHSYAYLNNPGWRARICLRLLRGANHIVLGEDMARRLVKVHEISRNAIVVLSNAAFVAPIFGGAATSPRTGPMTVGFLSNITEAKGIFEYFNAIEAIQRDGVDCRGIIAGPVDKDIALRFGAEMARNPALTYLGAVQGEAKEAFWQAVDTFFFPTRYVNEAEPVVLLEALQHGVPVLATNRGCIVNLLEGVPGSMQCEEDSFIANACAFAKSWHRDGSGGARTKQAFTERQQTAQLALKRLILEITTDTSRERELAT